MGTSQLMMAAIETGVGHVAAAIHAGATGYVMKPFTKDCDYRQTQSDGTGTGLMTGPMPMAPSC